MNNNLYEFGDFRLDPQNRVLRSSGAAVPLTPKAFDLLLMLVENAGRVVTKDELMKAVWPDSFVEESNLTQTVFMVRKALDEMAGRRYILTVQGQGYRFLVPVKKQLENRRANRGRQKASVPPRTPSEVAVKSKCRRTPRSVSGGERPPSPWP